MDTLVYIELVRLLLELVEFLEGRSERAER